MKTLNKLIISTFVLSSTLTACNFGAWMGWNEMPQGQYYFTVSNISETDNLLGGCDYLTLISANTLAQVNNNSNIRIGGSDYSSSQVNLDNNPCFNQKDNFFGTQNIVQFSNCKSGQGTYGQYTMDANLTIINPDTESTVCTADVEFAQMNNV